MSEIKDKVNQFEAEASVLEAGVANYRAKLQELTGHDPNKAVTALDVVKIVQKLFFEGKKDA